MTRSAIGEYHYTVHRWPETISHLAVAAGVFALLFFVYAFVQLVDDNARLRGRLAAMSGCASQYKGQPFLFSAEENVNLLRPGTARVACYYKKGVQS